MKYRELLKIPDEYNTIEKKLEYLDKLILIEKKSDRMEQDYHLELFRTKEYWRNILHSKNEIRIPKMKSDLLEKINDLKNKIEKEEPFPHGNMDLDFLCEVSDKLEEVLNNWYY